MKSTTENTNTLGSIRQTSDMRQIAALMLVTGVCAIFFTVVVMVTLIGPDGSTPSSGVAFAALFGAVCEFAVGVLSLFVGYHQLVHDRGHKNLTLFVAFLTQTAFIPYIADMYTIGKQAEAGAGFINPEVFNPSVADVRFVGAMGIIAILVYGVTLIGSISFQHFTLYAYQTNKQHTRGALYFKGRLAFYSVLLGIAGFSQLALGAYVRHHFGAGPLEAPIGVAVYVVSYPEIAIFVGLIQVLTALWGVARSFNVGRFMDMDFQATMFAAWFLQLLLQVVVQIGILPGGTLAAAAAQVTAVTFGLNLMPAYLDYKAQTLPVNITPEYYGGIAVYTEDTDAKDEDVERQPVSAMLEVAA